MLVYFWAGGVADDFPEGGGGFELVCKSRGRGVGAKVFYEFVPLERNFVVASVSFFAVVNVQEVAESKRRVAILLDFFRRGHHVHVELKVVDAGLGAEKVAEAGAKGKAAGDKAG